MKGAEGEGAKISEREKGGVSGIPCSPRHGLGLGFSGPLPFLEAVTQDAQELDSQASLWQRSVYILDAEPSFREEGLTFPAPSKPLHCPCSKRTSPWPGRWEELSPLLQGRTGNGSVFFYLQPMTIVWKINEACFS